MITIKIQKREHSDKTEYGLKKELKQLRAVISLVEDSGGKILEDIEQWNDLYDQESDIISQLQELLGLPNVLDF